MAVKMAFEEIVFTADCAHKVLSSLSSLKSDFCQHFDKLLLYLLTQMRFVMSVEKDGFVELFIASQLALKLWLVMINLIIEMAIKIVNRKVSDYTNLMILQLL